MKKKQSSSKKKDTATAISEALKVHIADYESMRSEIMALQGFQAQILLYSIIALGAAIPIMVSLLDKGVWVSLLFLPIVFGSMQWVYSGYIGMMYRNAVYTKYQLRPKINNLLQLMDNKNIIDVLTWESFSRSKTLRYLAFPKMFEPIFFLVPSIGSITFFFIIKSMSSSPLSKGEIFLLGFDILLNLSSTLIMLLNGLRGYRLLASGEINSIS